MNSTDCTRAVLLCEFLLTDLKRFKSTMKSSRVTITPETRTFFIAILDLVESGRSITTIEIDNIYNGLDHSNKNYNILRNIVLDAIKNQPA